MTKAAAVDDAAWEDRATQLIKHVMRARRVGYKELAKALETVGVFESPRALTNRINRGKFSLVLFLQCVHALEFKLTDVPWGAFEELNLAPKHDADAP